MMARKAATPSERGFAGDGSLSSSSYDSGGGSSAFS